MTTSVATSTTARVSIRAFGTPEKLPAQMPMPTMGAMTGEPTIPEPDVKDWTWVLERPCPDCAFDPAAIEESDYASAIRQATLPWQYVLTRSDARQRPQPQVWSPLEYAAHVRDVCTVFDARTRLMLDEEDPGFANWDQDEAALAGRYWEADPAVVREELAGAAGRLVTTYEQIPGDAWERTGRRSNGSNFTVRTLGRYLLHDLVHHVWDVRA